MLKLFSFSSIKNRLTFWFLIISLIPLIFTITVIYFQRIEYIKQSAIEKLTTIRDLKVLKVNEWLNENEADIKVIAITLSNKQIENFNPSFSLAQQDITRNRIRKTLIDVLSKTNSISGLLILNPKTGIIEVSTNISEEGIDQSKNEYFLKPLETGEIHIKDVYYSENTRTNEMTYSLPIMSEEKRDNKIIGVLVARINLHENLYPILLNRIGLGKTGETLLGNKDSMAINELRWYENAPLNLKIKAAPLIKGVQGNIGIIEDNDYRGIAVLAAYTHITKMKWGFVAKQDQSEVYAPIQKLMRDFSLILLGTIVLITLFARIISTIIANRITKMAAVAHEIANGNYTVRNEIKGHDEIAILGKTINKATDEILSKINLEKNISKISKAVIGHDNFKAFGASLNNVLTQLTKAELAIFYHYDTEKSEFSLIHSVGANKKLTQSNTILTGEGELGIVLFKKEIHHITNLPNDTVFTYKSSIGDMVLKELISIPILYNGQVNGVLSLASVHHFDEEMITLLKAALPTIAAAYQNLIETSKINKLAAELADNNRELEEKSVELESQSEELQIQSTELQNISEELQQQNYSLVQKSREVEEATRLKSEFLSNMSHELRTPLNSILALSNVLRTQTSDRLNEEELSYLEIVERNGKNLLYLINDILDLSKIEAGHLDLYPTEFNPKVVIEEVTRALEPLADKKKLKLSTNISSSILNITTDESRFRQILTNIVNNAIKFTENGSVTIDAFTKEDQLEVTVKDTGMGISDEHIHTIFDKFRQIDGSSSRSYEGTGLGLSIVLELLNKLNGGIKVESTLGVGTTFSFMIPINCSDAKKQSAVTTNNIIPIETSKKYTVLVVDDDPKALKEMVNFLADEGFQIITANNGKEAIRLAEMYQPFAITLDIIMPEMDGFEVLQKLKENPKTDHIPVIIVSVSKDKETGIALGAVGQIQKPILKRTLINEIHRLHKNPNTIMLVDDNEFEIKYLSAIIAEDNFTVISANGGQECLNLLEKQIPDVMVLDLMMPDINGFEVLKSIRSKKSTKDLPVIIVTSKDLTEKEKNMLKQEVSSVITKGRKSQDEVLKEIKSLLFNIKTQNITKISKTSKLISEKRILIVEDNETATIQIKYVLEKEGYTVDIANNGEEAITYLKTTIPDGIILDLMMPKVDGFELLDFIRTHTKTAEIPVLVLTAKVLSAKEIKTLERNNVQHLVQKGDIDVQGLLQDVHQMTSEGITLKPESNNNFTKSTILKKSFKKDEPIKLLIVEDNPDNMTTIKALLKGNYIITEAMDGEEGIDKAIKQLPDLILLDMLLPKKDGLEVASILKATQKTAHIPIIAVTAKAMKEDKETILKGGCDGYVSKPIQEDKLSAEINKFIEFNTF